MTDFYGGLLLGTVFGILWNHVALKRSHAREAHWRQLAENAMYPPVYVYGTDWNIEVSAAIDSEEQSSSGYGEDAEDADDWGDQPLSPSVYQELTPERIQDGWVDEV